MSNSKNESRTPVILECAAAYSLDPNRVLPALELTVFQLSAVILNRRIRMDGSQA